MMPKVETGDPIIPQVGGGARMFPCLQGRTMLLGTDHLPQNLAQAMRIQIDASLTYNSSTQNCIFLLWLVVSIFVEHSFRKKQRLFDQVFQWFLFKKMFV